MRHRAAGEPGAAAARDDRDVVGVAPCDDGGHLIRARGQRDRVGASAQVAGLGGVDEVLARRTGEDVLGSEQADELAGYRGSQRATARPLATGNE